MEVSTAARLLLIYAHLLLCVFALHEVLVGDWRVLRRSLYPVDLHAMHRRVSWLLMGLWISGLAVIAIDVGFDPMQLPTKPKIVAKLVTVLVLSANGLLLQHWCFPRLLRLEALGAVEMSLVAVAGAVSTASWLTAAFFGVARALSAVPLVQLLELYGAILGVATLAALLLAAHWRRQLDAGAAAQPLLH